MAEITPLGVVVQDAKTDVKASVAVPHAREMLEISYNDFLDAKLKDTLEPGKGIGLDMKFDTWIGMSVRMLKHHRASELRQQWEIGQIGLAEFEALEEVRKKLLYVLEHADPSHYGFDQYGIQYVPVAQRDEYKQKIGKDELLTPSHRDIKIKSSNGNGILRS